MTPSPSTQPTSATSNRAPERREAEHGNQSSDRSGLPAGRPSAANFAWRRRCRPGPTVPVPHHLLSLDPASRAMSDAASYANRCRSARWKAAPSARWCSTCRIAPAFLSATAAGRVRPVGTGEARRSIPTCADLDRARRARHAGQTAYVGLPRSASPRPAKRWWWPRPPPGRLDGRPDREDQGLPRGRYRRLRKCAYVGRARLRRLPRSPAPDLERALSAACPMASTSTGRTSAAGVRGGAAAAQRVRARAGVRPDRLVQRHRAAARPDRTPLLLRRTFVGA